MSCRLLGHSGNKLVLLVTCDPSFKFSFFRRYFFRSDSGLLLMIIDLCFTIDEFDLILL